MHDNSRARLPKIGIDSNRGAIRLRFTYQGQQYSLTGLGKYDDLVALQNAKGIVEKIKLDLLTGNFPVGDYKLGKYSLHKAPVSQLPVTTPTTATAVDKWHLGDCWEYYKKCKPNAPASTRNLWRYIDNYIASCDTSLLSVDNAAEFLLYLKTKEADGSIAPRWRIIKAAVNHCLKLKKIDSNPYAILYEELNVTSKKEIKAFSKREIKVIIHAFKSGRFDADKSAYSSAYYAPLVEFRFLTGCRPSEAIGLTWDNVKWKGEDKCQIVFDSRYSYGEVLEGTKNGIDARIFNCNKQLREFIKTIPHIPNKNNLVFPSLKGGYIARGNFVNVWWRPIINKLIELKEVEAYAPFYDQRHTFGTHVARSTLDLKTLSSIMGNSPDTLMKNYLAKDNDSDFVPEF